MARSSKQSAKEKYERQKALTRERVRRHREKMSEEKKEEKKKYDRDRLARLKAENKVRRIGDMTAREQRKMRKYWRERNRVRSQKKKSLIEVTDTPPDSPSGDAPREESSQKRRGRKQVRKDKAKAYRTVAKQKDQIQMLERKLAKYKKRLEREKKKHKTNASPSPRKQVSNILRGERVSPQVKKQLFLGIALRKQIKSQTKEIAGTKKKNQILHKVVGNDVFKKYRIQKHFRDIVPYSANKVIHNSPSTSFEYTCKKRKCITNELADTLKKFFENDRVSKMCPGKRDFVKKGGFKKQRRILLDTLTNLHLQFEKETNIKISKTSFCRSRPFWVTFPRKADRETCGCIKHANMDLLVTALKTTNVIAQRNPSEVVKNLVCSTDSEQCMLSQCLHCKENEIEMFYEEDFLVKFYKWKSIKEEKLINNKKKEIKKTIKCKEVMKVSKLKAYLKNELTMFKQHVFYVKHQAVELNRKTESLSEGEILFRLDFSENYIAKYGSEVQSVHFGASKKQISLNTGVWYVQVDGTMKKTCFATASDNLDHQAHAVWSHMKPIFIKASNLFPETTTVHIFSDSPSNQYRNRINIHMLKTLLPTYFPRIQSITWNYTEAGHGKGPMDGVGGTLKREADKKVLRGNDITCAKDFISACKDYKVDLHEISSEDIEKFKSEMKDVVIPPIKGIMKAHQITWSSNVMYARTLSCFSCPTSNNCSHYTLGEVFPPEDILSANLPTDDFPLDDFHIDDLPIDCHKKKANAKQTKIRKLTVDEVYSSSDEEFDHPGEGNYDQHTDTSKKQDFIKIYECNKKDIKSKIVSGAHVLVEYEIVKGKKSKSEQFIGVCQNDLKDNEIVVMFLKNCSKDNRLFFANEKDVVSVPLNQIRAVFPTPVVVLKGNRVFFKFKLSEHK